MAGNAIDLARELGKLPENHPIRVAGEQLLEIELGRLRREEELRRWENKERGLTP